MVLSSPAAELSPADAAVAAAAAGAHAAAEFAALLPAVENEIAALGALDVLARFAFYGTATPDGTNVREWTEAGACLQHHVEVVQALALRRVASPEGGGLVVPAALGELFDRVRALTAAFALRRLGAAADLPPPAGRAPRHDPAGMVDAAVDAARARLLALESMRGDTQAIRNPGYGHQVRDLLTRVFAPLDPEFARVFGVTATGLVGMWFRVVRVVEERANAHLRRCRAFRRAKTPARAVAAFAAAFPEGPSADALLERVTREGRGADEVRWLLQAHADQGLWRVHTFTLDDFAAAYAAGLPEEVAPPRAGAPGGGQPNDGALREALARVLGHWTLEFGALAGANPEHLFLANPVWRRPLIGLGSVRYFLTVASMFFGFGMEQLELLVDADPALGDRYERRRASFLEEDVVRLLGEALPGAQVFRGTLWTDPETGREYENDVLVLLGGHAVVAEAKAGRVTGPARRGAPDRLRHTVAELLGKAAEQATRFAGYLEARPGPHRLRSRGGAEHVFDTSGVHVITPLCVTLDHLAMGGAPLKLLRDAGLLGTGGAPGGAGGDAFIPAMNAYDLRCVTELLDEPATLLHYLARRGDVEREFDYQGDETDLLGFYLETGFNVAPSVDADGARLSLLLTGHSRVIEPWFVSRYTGRHAPRPQPRRAPWFRDLLAALGARRPPGWTVMAHALLDVGAEEQRAFAHAVDVLRRQRRARVRPPGAPDHVALAYGAPGRRRQLVALALPAGGRDERRAAFERVGRQAAAEHPDRLTMIVGRDSRDPAAPYDLIGVFGRPGARPRPPAAGTDGAASSAPAAPAAADAATPAPAAPGSLAKTPPSAGPPVGGR